MSTRDAMMARIRRDLRRGTTLDADILDAINDAIAAYRADRFAWAESRTQATFDTVDGQEFYTAADDEALGRLITVDWITVTIGTQPYKLNYYSPETIELWASTTTKGQPYAWTRYEDKLRLYPMPAAVYPSRVAGAFSVAAPATGGETGNPWMTTGERLIRCRAKLELAVHRLRAPALAADMQPLVEDAYSQLKTENNKKTGTGYVRPYW